MEWVLHAHEVVDEVVDGESIGVLSNDGVAAERTVGETEQTAFDAGQAEDVEAGRADRTQRLAPADRAHQLLRLLPDESHEISVHLHVLAAIVSLLFRMGQSAEGAAGLAGLARFRILVCRYCRSWEGGMRFAMGLSLPPGESLRGVRESTRDWQLTTTSHTCGGRSCTPSGKSTASGRESPFCPSN